MYFLVTFTPPYFSMQVQLLTSFGFIGKLCKKLDFVLLLSGFLPPQQKRVPLQSLAWTNMCTISWFKSAPNLAFHHVSFSIVFVRKQPSKSWCCSMLKKWTKLMFKVNLSSNDWEYRSMRESLPLHNCSTVFKHLPWEDRTLQIGKNLCAVFLGIWLSSVGMVFICFVLQL
ncbi:hypothetical protein BT93_E2583 [Corymbia citriodora subsp. variegata]|nr:hypothetical protein BT93_E2582 [Corymbia citriodora subsp. variegata]KAF8030187.1 hypothetical protein BT93_E2583 [Corymbia citriodora subsp. variegata]